MGGRIHILPAELANKIAAGEVVQRPASAVKELIENSLDAGATAVEVHVRDAGKALIQVIDNGSGMSEEDAIMSFRRHATSKIRTPEDLERIHTLGFRGEALASIAAVAQVELRTRTSEDDTATIIRVDGDTIKDVTRTAAGIGTSVTVRHLFYNTPGRRNFLKTRQTELKAIADVVMRMAVITPSIAWMLVSDDETLLDVRASSPRERAAAVLGERLGSTLMECSEETEYLSIRGFLARPEFARRSRTEQYLFLNGRPIQNKMIAHAVFQGYEHLLINGGFPLFVLDLRIDPSRVDVNVHPSKHEVKFENDSTIYRMVLSVVRNTLGRHDLVPKATFHGGEAVAAGADRFALAPSSPSDVPILSFARTEVEPLAVRTVAPAEMSGGAPSPSVRIVAHPVAATTSSEPDARAIWQIQNKYIISQVRSGLVIVDQHVAHERVLYERVLANFENSLPAVQQLLFPQTLELTPADYALAKALEQHLHQLGFDLKLFGKNTIVIEGIPADVKVENEKKILLDVLEEYKANEHASVIDERDRLAKSFACKAAIKAGDPLSPQEMTVLIEQLFQTKMPYVCPHGRPVVIRIPVEELDKRFGRT